MRWRPTLGSADIDDGVSLWAQRHRGEESFCAAVVHHPHQWVAALHSGITKTFDTKDDAVFWCEAVTRLEGYI